ncbi:helix-hairpin-helix domain-containing protein [Sphingomonas sp. Leaf62]|uniref:helix-hairpin-helix domain-containing protein n=1 Tax=Sphingomonas sp. Leaf62 TaxID=1736228 RepID=UPI0006FF7D77|nr:PHP domain-containing protein [Sphingomonas sp. Leaf62]KQN74708.1 DNA polymerase [Sphingomonas sp. Leaf62]
MTTQTTYVELQVTSHFSFLRGASSPDELFAAAALLGHSALGLTDLGSVAGLMRGWEAQKTTGVRMIAGARVRLDDGRVLLLYPTDKPAWSRLTRLLTLGKSRAGKSGCALAWEDVVTWNAGMIAILLPDLPSDATRSNLGDLQEVFGDRGYCALTFRRRPDDAMRLHDLARQATDAQVATVAVGDILYHAPDARLLQDVVTAIREKCTVDTLGYRRERHADRHLKSPEEMERRFAAFPDAIRATAEIARRCTFDLGDLSYQYPDERVVDGLTAQQALEQLTEAAVERRFPDGVPVPYRTQIDHELRLIAELAYAPYFLTVNSIVAESRRRGILCQGRGSAANSCVCFMLGITSIDPIKHELLFERLISGERREPPDIDVDFEHERREEIIQWIYETYGRTHAALTAVVTRYRARGAVREVGKALGLPEDLTKALAGLVWGWSQEGVGEKQVQQLNLNMEDRRLRLALDLARRLIGTPRHLSQHPGGFVLTHDRLDDLVPIEPAAMVDRQVIEWDKDDIDALKFMKVDVLGLGMLGCMNRAFNLLEEADQLRRAMATFKFTGGVSHFFDKLVGGMVERGYPRDFAERTFKQIEGFGSYGFPESHAASFAKIAYASCWMKHHHPDVFCAALLNAQPMGFYAPAQVVRDARDHGVEVRPACINASRWDCTLEPGHGRYLAVRLGLRQVRGLANAHGAAIVTARGQVPFGSVEEVWRRAGVPRAAIERLAEADTFHTLGEDRRQGLWKVKGLSDIPLPLFAADARESLFSPEGLEPDVSLRPLSDGREVVEDYRALQLSLRAHPLAFLRQDLTRRGITRCADLANIKDGRHVEVAGIILVRQKPGSAKGVLFITVEDETGIANGILWPDRFEAQPRTVMSAAMIGMEGRVQKEGQVIHVICDRIIDHGSLLAQVGQMDFPHTTGRGDGARHAGSPDRGDAGWKPGPRDSYWLPHNNGMDPEDVVRVKSRDFH